MLLIIFGIVLLVSALSLSTSWFIGSFTVMLLSTLATVFIVFGFNQKQQTKINQNQYPNFTNEESAAYFIDIKNLLLRGAFILSLIFLNVVIFINHTYSRNMFEQLRNVSSLTPREIGFRSRAYQYEHLLNSPFPRWLVIFGSFLIAALIVLYSLAKANRFRSYVRAMHGEKSIKVAELAQSIKKDEMYILNDINRMIRFNWFKQGYLSTDQKTLYIIKPDEQDLKKSWTCIYCRAVNPTEELICQSCNAPKKEL